MNKILSLIIPSYNMEAYLPKCLGSLIVDDQELLQKLDVIVVNDGSKDRTSEIAHGFEAKYPGVFRVINKANGHYGSCINAGLALASGIYVRILDADDWFDTKVFGEFLSFIDNLLRRNEIADLILSKYALIDSDGHIVRTGKSAYPENGIFAFDVVANATEVPVMHGTTYRTSILKEMGYTQTEGILYTDTEWVFSPMMNVERVAYFPKVVYNYLIGREGQSMSSDSWQRFCSHRLTVFRNLVSFYLSNKCKAKPDKKFLMERCLRKTFLTVFDGYYVYMPINKLNADLHPLCASVSDVVGAVMPDEPIFNSIPLLRVSTAKRWLRSRHLCFVYPALFRLYVKMAKMFSFIKPLVRKFRGHHANIFARIKQRYLISRLFAYDKGVFRKYAGSVSHNGKWSRVAEIVMSYHVIEKGLTMPRRRLGFGHDAVLNLIALVDAFEHDWGTGEKMVHHAVGVVKEYLNMHEAAGYDFTVNEPFWTKIRVFCDGHKEISPCKQLHITAEEFFAHINSPFPEFATSRHTCRHYSGGLPLDTVKKAVKLAMTAPSACNRQHVRVHCISSHEKRDVIYTLQNGNRGFGQDADKLLVITSDLNCLRWNEERNDIYTNAGMFLMNLCYALHYYKVAHCILNWSVGPDADKKMHALLSIPENERIAALIACGPMPAEADIAASPRKDFKDIFFNHE